MNQGKQNSNLSEVNTNLSQLPKVNIQKVSYLSALKTADKPVQTKPTVTNNISSYSKNNIKPLKIVSQDGRPTFFHNNDPDKPIRAGGILFYKKTKEGIEFLMFYCNWKNSNNKFEDIGGKTDASDSSIEATIAREIEEETNKKITKKTVLDIISKSTPIYSGKKTKYLSYIIEAPPEINKLTKLDFGDVEEHTKWERTITWVKKYEILPFNPSGTINLSERIYENNTPFFDKLKSIN